MNPYLKTLVTLMHSSGVGYEDAVRAFRRQYLCEALVMNRGRCGKTAQELGVHRNTLTRMMRELGTRKSDVRTALKKMPRGVRPPAASERKVSA